MITADMQAALNAMPTYKQGDKDTRGWGHYEVLAVTADSCTKTITVNPYKMLSLQVHAGRAEEWRVEQGTLTALIDGVVHTVPEGGSVQVPLQALHCMANLTSAPVTVIEIQRGLCREADNARIADVAEPPRQLDAVTQDAKGNVYIGLMNIQTTGLIFKNSCDAYNTLADQVKAQDN